MTSSRLQRDLGLLAVEAEEGRHRAEEMLGLERNRSAELAAEVARLEARLVEAGAAVVEEQGHAVRAAEDHARQTAASRAEAEELRRLLAEAQNRTQHEAVLREEADNLRHRLREALEQVASLHAEADGLRCQSAKAQEDACRTVALRAENEGLLRQLMEAREGTQQAIALKAEAEHLRRQLAQALDSSDMAELWSRLNEAVAEAKIEVAAACADAPMERNVHDATASQLALASELPSESDASVGQMQRELNGMRVVTRTLEGKLRSYEKKLLEQSRTCAEEINDLKCTISCMELRAASQDRPCSFAGPNSLPSGNRRHGRHRWQQDEAPALDEEDDAGDAVSFGNGAPGLFPWTWMPPSFQRVAADQGDGYVRLARSDGDDLDSNTLKTVPAAAPPATVAAATTGPEARMYEPPKLPDAI